MTTAAVPQDEEYRPPPRSKRARSGPPRKSEADIVKAAIAYINSLPRAVAHKVHGGAFTGAGEPDVDAVISGRAVKLEAKVPGNKPTAVQMGMMRRYSECGALVGWFTSVDEVKELLDHLKDDGYSTDLGKSGCTCPTHQRNRKNGGQ